MINTRYKKVTRMHAGHIYVVTAPSSEIGNPMNWTLQCETIASESLIVAENELTDVSRWQPLDK